MQQIQQQYYRVAKMHEVFICIGPCPQKSHITNGSFAENNLQFRAAVLQGGEDA